MKTTHIEKIIDFAKKCDVKLYKEISQGWKVREGALTAPLGTIWIYNAVSHFDNSKIRENGLMLDIRFFNEFVKEGLEDLKEKTKNADTALTAWERHPELKSLENAYNVLYDAEFHSRLVLTKYLAVMTGMEEKTIRNLLMEKENKIIELLSKAV